MSELTEKDLIKNLKNYLIQHGYPDESIVSEYKLGKYRADLVIIDIDTNTPIQLFELKNSRNKNFLDMGRRQLEQFIKEARKLNTDIIGYLVFPTENTPYFEAINYEDLLSNKTSSINDINVKNKHLNNIDDIIQPKFNYNDQIKRSRLSNTEIIKTKKVEAVDELKEKISNLLFFIISLFVLDIFNIIKLTQIRFYMIIVISVLYIIPYYEEIKIFNLEFKKQKNEKHGNYPQPIENKENKCGKLKK